MTGDDKNPGKDKTAGEKEDQGRQAPPVPRNVYGLAPSVTGLNPSFGFPTRAAAFNRTLFPSTSQPQPFGSSAITFGGNGNFFEGNTFGANTYGHLGWQGGNCDGGTGGQGRNVDGGTGGQGGKAPENSQAPSSSETGGNTPSNASSERPLPIGNNVGGLEGLLNLPPVPPQLIADLAAQHDISAQEFAQRMIELVMQVGEGLINHPDLTLILHFVEALFFNPVQQNEQLLPLSTATEDILRICQLLTPELRRYLERYLHVDGSGGNPATGPKSTSGGANKRASGAEISSDAAKRLRTFGPGDKVNLYFNSINIDDPLPALHVRPIPGGFSLEFGTAPAAEPQVPDQVRSNASAPCLPLFSDSTRNQNNNSTATSSGENVNEEAADFDTYTVGFDEYTADYDENDEEEF